MKHHILFAYFPELSNFTATHPKLLSASSQRCLFMLAIMRYFQRQETALFVLHFGQALAYLEDSATDEPLLLTGRACARFLEHSSAFTPKRRRQLDRLLGSILKTLVTTPNPVDREAEPSFL